LSFSNDRFSSFDIALIKTSSEPDSFAEFGAAEIAEFEAPVLEAAHAGIALKTNAVARHKVAFFCNLRFIIAMSPGGLLRHIIRLAKSRHCGPAFSKTFNVIYGRLVHIKISSSRQQLLLHCKEHRHFPFILPLDSAASSI
jgi:hypothetical protein